MNCFIVRDGPERQRLERLAGEPVLLRNLKFWVFLPTAEEVYSLMIARVPKGRFLYARFCQALAKGFAVYLQDVASTHWPLTRKTAPCYNNMSLIVGHTLASIYEGLQRFAPAINP